MKLSRRTDRLLRVLLGAAVSVAVVIGCAFIGYATIELATAPLPLQFDLRPGSSLRAAAQEMERAGVLRGCDVRQRVGVRGRPVWDVVGVRNARPGVLRRRCV